MAPPSGANTAQQRRSIVNLPKRSVKGPRPDADISQTAAAITQLVSQGNPVQLAGKSPYHLFEFMLVLSSAFAQHKSAEVVLSKYTAKQGAEGEKKADGATPAKDLAYYRLNVRPAASAAPSSAAPAAEVKQLGVSKEADSVKLSFQILKDLEQLGQVQVGAVGPYAVYTMIQAVHRATVRARAENKKQLVVSGVSLDLAQVKLDKSAEPDPRGPAKSVVLTLQLKPLDEPATA